MATFWQRSDEAAWHVSVRARAAEHPFRAFRILPTKIELLSP
jgi:hypothetical protein